MFDGAFNRVNTFVDFKTELVEGSSKRAEEELTQESAKKQKVDDNKETAELKKLMEIITDKEEVTIDAIPFAVKSLKITTAGTRVKTVSESYYCKYKEVTTAQVEYKVNAAEELQLLEQRKAKKSVRLMMEKLFGIELELILPVPSISYYCWVNVNAVEGEGSSMPTDPHHTPTILQPSTSQPQKTWKPRNPKRKNTQVPQPSGSNGNVVDEAVHKELGDCLVRAAITASSIEAEQGSGNINKTQSKETPNEPSSYGTDFGGAPRVESSNEESLGENASKQVRRIDAIDQDEDITLVNVQDDTKMFDVDDLGGEEVFVAEQEVVSTAATTEELTLA
uniref:Uncharacterized protein n=1 Tax=Tanacetum cinerariifolium TaxID=118510 RepID=A0A6L2KSY3_TANCI|nr:hypothetical protein [Tanacetum cinerariifolium]